MLKAFGIKTSRCEAAPVAPIDDRSLDVSLSKSDDKFLSLSQIGMGWATCMFASITWSLANPAHRTLRMSQRVIHARIAAQGITITTLGVAAIAEFAFHKKGSQENRNVTLVTKAVRTD